MRELLLEYDRLLEFVMLLIDFSENPFDSSFLKSAFDVVELTSAQKLMKAPSEPFNAYLKEKTEHVQDQIIKIRNSVEDR